MGMGDGACLTSREKDGETPGAAAAAGRLSVTRPQYTNGTMRRVRAA